MSGFYRRSAFRIMGFLGTAALVTACGGGGGGSSVSGTSGASGAQGALTAQQMSDIAYSSLHEFVSGMETGVSSLSTNQRSAQSDPCTAVSPSPPVINADGIPANETYVHTNCKDLPWAMGETVNGQVNITDTSVNLNNLSYTQTDTNLSVSGNDNGTPFTVVRNGQRFVGSNGDGKTFSVTRLITAVRTTPNGTLDIADNWESHFTSDPGQSVVLLQQLPAGKFDEAHGSATYLSGTLSVTVNFNITKPLHFDPTCTSTPMFTSGVIQFDRTGGSNPGSFTATYSGCGTPPVIAAVSSTPPPSTPPPSTEPPSTPPPSTPPPSTPPPSTPPPSTPPPGPPSGVPSGPPSGVPSGPPSGVPSGPPSGVPQGPPSSRPTPGRP